MKFFVVKRAEEQAHVLERWEARSSRNDRSNGVLTRLASSRVGERSWLAHACVTMPGG